MLGMKIIQKSEGYILDIDTLYKDDILKSIQYAIDIQNEDNLGIDVDEVVVKLQTLKDNIMNNKPITLDDLGMLIHNLALNLDI